MTQSSATKRLLTAVRNMVDLASRELNDDELEALGIHALDTALDVYHEEQWRVPPAVEVIWAAAPRAEGVGD